MSWGSAQTVKKMLGKLVDLIKDLPDNLWENIYKSLKQTLESRRYQNYYFSIKSIDLDNSLNLKSAVLISLRAKPETRKLLYSKYIQDYEGSNQLILRLCQEMSLEFLADDYSIWDEVREVIQRCYKSGVLFEPYTFHRISREIVASTMPESISVEIASQPSSYPGFLVALAEMKMREKVASTAVPVGEIAKRDRWFEHL